MGIAEELGDRLTPASLDSLAAALAIRWPAWYPPFVLALAATPNEARPYWLSGGFIFSSPQDVYEETHSFRTGKQFFCGGSSAQPGEPHPLPERYIVVGRTGEGPVIVDTASDSPVLLWLSNEGYWQEPLIDFAAEGKSPIEVARLITSGPDAA